MDRKDRERARRGRRVVATARSIAEGEGWKAVTIRRLAAEIEYTQPVLYSHFAGRDAIVTAVAVEGFRELAIALRRVAGRSMDPAQALRKAAATYLAYARTHPAVYAAMFTLPTSLRFAQPDTAAELREAFAALAALVAPLRSDVELATETLWAALHGLAELERTGRIRRRARDARVALVVRALGGEAESRE